MSGTQLERNTDLLLHEWGEWARTDKIRLEARGTLGRLSGSTVKSCVITDIDGELIDSLVSRLRLRDHEMGTVIRMYYEYQFNYRKIGLRLKIGKDKARQLVLSGTAWIDAALIFAQTQGKKYA